MCDESKAGKTSLLNWLKLVFNQILRLIKKKILSQKLLIVDVFKMKAVTVRGFYNNNISTKCQQCN